MRMRYALGTNSYVWKHICSILSSTHAFFLVLNKPPAGTAGRRFRFFASWFGLGKKEQWHFFARETY